MNGSLTGLISYSLLFCSLSTLSTAVVPRFNRRCPSELVKTYAGLSPVYATSLTAHMKSVAAVQNSNAAMAFACCCVVLHASYAVFQAPAAQSAIRNASAAQT